jgi:hypothetical protein
MGLVVPESVVEILQRFESQRCRSAEFELAEELKNALRNYQEPDRSGAWAEYAAFTFRPSEHNPWGTFFGPMATAARTDGTILHVPDLASVDASIIEHWELRANEAKHPVMKARYADLVWDFSRRAAQKKPHIRFACTAIDSYLQAADEGLFKMSVYGIEYLTRALQLAISINDTARIESVRDAMFRFFEQHAEVTKAGTWAFLFENLWNNKKVPVAETQAAKIIDSLEEFLRRSCDANNKEEFDPWRAEMAAAMLEKHYRQQNKSAEVQRVIRAYGQAFETAAASANPTLAIGWLQPVYDAYRSRGMSADAERVQLAIAEKGKDVHRDMEAFEVPINISKEELDAFLNALTDGDIKQALHKITARFIPKVQKAQEQNQQSLSATPLFARIPIVIDQSGMGHPEARIGGMEDDPEGRLIYQLSQNIEFESLFLAAALDKVRERHTLTAEQLADILFASPLFTDERRTLILEGISAYYNGDHVKAVHLLVPQIEHAMRILLVSLGIPASKPGAVVGTMQMKNLGDILWEPRIREFVPEDLRLYFTALLTDARGHNLRNRLCHGLLTHEELRRPISDRVIHVLLCLGLGFKKADPEKEPPK